MKHPVSLASIRRYPVKSMGGEQLVDVDVDHRGLVGDRWFAVTDDEGRFASGKSTRRFRRRDDVFAYTATRSGTTVQVSGPGGRWQVGEPALDAELSHRTGSGCGSAIGSAASNWSSSNGIHAVG